MTVASVSVFIISLILILNHFNFEPKAKWSLYIFGTIAMSIKSLLFFIPLWIGINQVKSKGKLVLLISTPFLLFLFYFLTIIMLKIEILWFDITYGYLSKYPHFYLQLGAVLIPSIFLMMIHFRKLKALVNETKQMS